MKLYMVRHGQSEANQNGLHSGWGDFELTPLGEAQALAVGEKLKGLVFDKVYSSDLKRAIRTQELALPGVNCERTPLLREKNVGELVGKSFAKLTEQLGQSYVDNKREGDFSSYGGENYEDFFERVQKFIKEIERSGHQNVIAFCHHGVIRLMPHFILGFKVDVTPFICHNCGIYVFEYKNSRWHLESWNA
jgi:broad specificity phosphatase PhoE